MTFDEFYELCRFETHHISHDHAYDVVYFTSAFKEAYSEDFIILHRDAADKHVAKMLYDYLKEQFSNG